MAPTGLAGFRRRLAIIALLALAIRVVYALTIARHLNGIGDYFFYNWTADLLAKGKGYLSAEQLAYAGHTVHTAAHPPLWPMVLSITSWLGGHSPRVGDFHSTAYTAHRLTQALVGTGVVVAIGYLARRIGGNRA